MQSRGSIRSLFQTGISLFLAPPPLSAAVWPATVKPRASIGPTTGIPYANPAIVVKNSPNNTNTPYPSTKNPMSGNRNKIRAKPPRNAAVPRHFCRRAKKSNVLCAPRRSDMPARKRICFFGIPIIGLSQWRFLFFASGHVCVGLQGR